MVVIKGMNCPRNIRSLERKFQGTNSLGNEYSSIREIIGIAALRLRPYSALLCCELL